MSNLFRDKNKMKREGFLGGGEFKVLWPGYGKAEQSKKIPGTMPGTELLSLNIDFLAVFLCLFGLRDSQLEDTVVIVRFDLVGVDSLWQFEPPGE